MHETFFRILLTNLKKGLKKIDFSLQSQFKKNEGSLQTKQIIDNMCINNFSITAIHKVKGTSCNDSCFEMN